MQTIAARRHDIPCTWVHLQRQVVDHLPRGEYYPPNPGLRIAGDNLPLAGRAEQVISEGCILSGYLVQLNTVVPVCILGHKIEKDKLR